MMTPPRFFRVLGQKFTVTMRPNLTNEEQDTLLGYCNSDHLTVELHDGMAPAKEREVYLHEMTHAIFNLIDLHGRFPNGITDERLIERFVPVFLHTLRENPRVVAYLMERLP